MSERPINDPQSTPQAPASVDASAQQLASARRRHFIKMGSGIVPVALTLSSRPVMATNCMTASAWGSTMGGTVTNTSSYARASAKSTLISGAFTLSQWKAVDTSTTPNKAACGGWKNASINCTTLTSVKSYTVQSLCGGGTAGLAGTTKVWDVLVTTGTDVTSKYRRAMCVAWLNLKVSSSVAACVKDPARSTYNALTILGAIGSGGGTGPDGRTWSQQNVIDYLYANYISR